MNSQIRHKESALRPAPHTRVRTADDEIAIGLSAAVLAMRADEPVVAVLPADGGTGTTDGTLPCGPFLPRDHFSLENGVRSLVYRQTGLELGLAQQLCTFGDRSTASDATPAIGASVVVSVCYLALVPPARCHALDNEDRAIGWRSWYDFLPWEDWRNGRPECLKRSIEPQLKAWADEQPDSCIAFNGSSGRHQRLRLAFGHDGGAWDEEKALERYELLCEAGIAGDGMQSSTDLPAARPPRLRHDLQGDQTRVLASAISEIRRAIKVRPVIFDLMPDVFTLFELQKTVEAVLGPHLHKQNFRRLVEGGGLVEPTGDYRFRTGGRPAQLYRFRRDVLMERLAPGVRVKAGRA